MSIRGRKVVCYIISNITFVFLYILTLFVAPNVLAVLGGIIIASIQLITFVFIGGNTFDKYIKSKYYREELDK